MTTGRKQLRGGRAFATTEDVHNQEMRFLATGRFRLSLRKASPVFFSRFTVRRALPCGASSVGSGQFLTVGQFLTWQFTVHGLTSSRYEKPEEVP